MELPPEVRRLIDGIRDDRVSGAHELAKRAAAALRLAARLDPLAVPDAGAAVAGAQPTMAPLYNLARAAAASGDVETACRDFLASLERNATAVARHGALLVPGGGVVLTHSYSSAVLEALLAAHRDGRHFRVIATESRPLREGLKLAERLGAACIPVTVIADAAIAAFLPRCRVAMVGADAVSAKGVTNKTGTALLALAAAPAGVPLYALCGSEKFLPASCDLPAEPPKNPRELLVCDLPNVTAENFYFESIPLERFAGVITEDGLLTPGEVERVLNGN